MAPLVYGFPAVPFKLAASARIKLAGNGLYGSGDLVGTLVTPKSQKIRAIFDSRPATGPAKPYWVWGAKSGVPDADQSSRFGAAGTATSITAHIYSGQAHSTDEADEICNRVVQLFHHQPLAMTGWRTDRVSCEVIDVVPDPIGQHGILVFRSIAQVVPA